MRDDAPGPLLVSWLLSTGQVPPHLSRETACVWEEVAQTLKELQSLAGGRCQEARGMWASGCQGIGLGVEGEGQIWDRNKGQFVTTGTFNHDLE